jgi:hypothetical protein
MTITKTSSDDVNLKAIQGQLWCANCGFDYVHFYEPEAHYEGDEYGSPLGTRGNWIAIPYWCEGCDKITILNISFHKGQIFYQTYVLEKTTKASYPHNDICRTSGPPPLFEEKTGN